MMTNANAKETERQKLGKAIRFYREQRRITPRDLADRVGVSVGDIENWELGVRAPPKDRWGRLCNMLHDKLSEMRATWQRALGEDMVAQEALKTSPGPLTAKPFANLKEVLAAPLKLSIVPPTAKPSMANVPHTLRGDDFDLRPAYIGVQKLPPGWNTAEQKTARQVFALQMIEDGKLTSDEIVAEVKRKFGVGISPSTLTELRAQVQAARKRKPLATDVEVSAPPPPVPTPIKEPVVATQTPPSTYTSRIEYAKIILSKAPSMTAEQLHNILTLKFHGSLEMDTLVALANEAKATRVTGPQPIVKPTTPGVTNDADIEAATRLLLEAIPNLKEFRIDVDDAGEISVTHRVREVRVVETSGSMKLRKP